MLVHGFGKTHTGLRRKNNQDSFAVVENGAHALMGIVCDGIGGGNGGDVASKMAVRHMQDSFKAFDISKKTDVEIKRWLLNTIKEANDLVYTEASSNPKLHGMGTTMVGVIQCEDAAYIFNAGDSRTYGLYEDDFICLTEDHSYVADLLKKGEVSEEEARNHPNRNVLTNAVGVWDNIRIDVNKINKDYRCLLICSDGLHGYVSETMIRRILESDFSLEKKVDLLIQAALDAGGFDNVSVILIEKEDAA